MSTSIAQNLEDGRVAHELKRYKDAVCAFNRAYSEWKEAKESDSVLLSILDLRINSFVKLGQLKPANEDAKRMVRVDRTDARGYLRCAQIARRQSDYETALRWYHHALRNMAASDTLQDYVKTQLAKTKALSREKVVTANAMDPLATLPLEIVEMVAVQIEYRQLVALLRVSRVWNRVLGSIRPLSDTLDLSGSSRRKISWTVVKAGLQRISRAPRVIKAAHLTDPAAKLLRKHLEQWADFSTLRHLAVSHPNDIFNQLPLARYGLHSIEIGHKSAISLLSVRDILWQCRTLRYATFDNVCFDGRAIEMAFDLSHGEETALQPHLEELTMLSSSQSRIPRTLSVRFFNRFLNLCKLVLDGIDIISPLDDCFDLTGLPKLKYFSLRSASYPGQVDLPKSMEVWDTYSSRPRLPFRRGPQNTLPNLRAIHAHAVGWLPAALYSIRPGVYGGELEALSLQLCDLTFPEFYKLPRHRGPLFVRVKTLHLHSQKLDDTHLAWFLETFPAVESLSLENALVTGVFLAGLFRSLSWRHPLNLRQLKLRNCSSVSPDAIQWAISRGVSVQVRNEAETGHRRVREGFLAPLMPPW